MSEVPLYALWENVRCLSNCESVSPTPPDCQPVQSSHVRAMGERWLPWENVRCLPNGESVSPAPLTACMSNKVMYALQGYLAHKNLPPPRTLQ